MRHRTGWLGQAVDGGVKELTNERLASLRFCYRTPECINHRGAMEPFHIRAPYLSRNNLFLLVYVLFYWPEIDIRQEVFILLFFFLLLFQFVEFQKIGKGVGKAHPRQIDDFAFIMDFTFFDTPLVSRIFPPVQFCHHNSIV